MWCDYTNLGSLWPFLEMRVTFGWAWAFISEQSAVKTYSSFKGSEQYTQIQYIVRKFAILNTATGLLLLQWCRSILQGVSVHRDVALVATWCNSLLLSYSLNTLYSIICAFLFFLNATCSFHDVSAHTYNLNPCFAKFNHSHATVPSAPQTVTLTLAAPGRQPHSDPEMDVSSV